MTLDHHCYQGEHCLDLHQAASYADGVDTILHQLASYALELLMGNYTCPCVCIQSLSALHTSLCTDPRYVLLKESTTAKNCCFHLSGQTSRMWLISIATHFFCPVTFSLGTMSCKSFLHGALYVFCFIRGEFSGFTMVCASLPPCLLSITGGITIPEYPRHSQVNHLNFVCVYGAWQSSGFLALGLVI